MSMMSMTKADVPFVSKECTFFYFEKKEEKKSYFDRKFNFGAEFGIISFLEVKFMTCLSLC